MITAIPSPEARANLMNVAQRMVRLFSLHITSACGQSWTALSDSVEDTVRITTRKVTEPGQRNGLILTAVSTIWLPHPHYQVFDLLRDGRLRSQVHNSLQTCFLIHYINISVLSNILVCIVRYYLKWDSIGRGGSHCKRFSSGKLYLVASC